MAEEGRQQHPHNKKRRSEELRPPLLWEEVGLLPMRSDVSSSEGGGSTEPPRFSRSEGKCRGLVNVLRGVRHVDRFLHGRLGE